MSLTKSLLRRTSAILSVSRTLTSPRSLVSTSLGETHFSYSKIAPSLLQSSPTFYQFRLKSTAEACKFEVINVQDEEDFKKRVLENSRPVVVDFHATWCGPCKILGPRLEKLLSESNGEVLMAKVDIDDNSELAMEYGVRSVPTVMGLKNGKVHDQFVGLIDDDQIQTFVDKLAIS